MKLKIIFIFLFCIGATVVDAKKNSRGNYNH